MTDHERLEDAAKAIYWAAFERQDPYSGNPVLRLGKDEAWKRTSQAHRDLCLLQAQRSFEVFAKT